MTASAFTLFFIFLGASISPWSLITRGAAYQTKPIQDADIEARVRDLWSAKDTLRIKAKLDLAEIGTKAAPALLSLLQNLADHYYEPHYAKDGEYDEDITGRLASDCSELLAGMKYYEAIPTLIRIMEQPPTIPRQTMGSIYTPQVAALGQIGKPAIPLLTDALTNARQIALSICADPKRGLDLSGGPSVVGDTIVARAAAALGEIGDPSVIPLLEKALDSEEATGVSTYIIRLAIKSLRTKLPIEPCSDSFSAPGGAPETILESALAELRSPCESVRDAAKSRIIAAGRQATPALISVLSDLADHVYEPHFARTKEQDGERFWPDKSHHLDFIDQYEISNRLAGDCIEMLGETRSSEAVPVILRLMAEGEVIRGSSQQDGFLSKAGVALMKIGEPAVPALIEAFLNAEPIAFAICSERSRRLGGGCFADALADRIRMNTASILGNIGDRRALPALQSMLGSGTPKHTKFVNVSVELAISKIESKR